MASRQVVSRLWRDAQRFERQTRQAVKQDGAVRRHGLAVLQALLLHFLNYKSGGPSRSAIADRACISECGVGRGLVVLQVAGVWREGSQVSVRISNLWAGSRVTRPDLPRPIPATVWRSKTPEKQNPPWRAGF